VLLKTKDMHIQLAWCDELDACDDSVVNRVVIFIKSWKDIGHKLINSKSSVGGRHVINKGSHLATIFGVAMSSTSDRILLQYSVMKS
jgi:hypothetical protein